MFNFFFKVNPLTFIRLITLLIEAVETIEVTTSSRPSAEKKQKALEFFRSAYDTVDSFSNFDAPMDDFFKNTLAPKAIDLIVEWFNKFGWNIPTIPPKKG